MRWGSALKQYISRCSTWFLISGGLFLLCTLMAFAQIGGQPGSQLGRTNGADSVIDNLNHAGIQSGSPETAQSSSQKNMERDFLSNILRDGNAETALSEMATQQSNDDQVKKFAHEMIVDNQRISQELYSGSLGNICPVISQTPARVRDIAKKMKTLDGVQFDGTYLSQLEAYVRHDQEMLKDSPNFSNFLDMETTVSQMKLLADDRVLQIGKLAESENIVLQ
jgi:predicted outer membrane protein